MSKEEFIPQELFEHYNIKLFDINRTNNVYDLILKMWNEQQDIKSRIDKAIEYLYHLLNTAYLEESDKVDIGLIEYTLSLIIGSDK